VTTFEESIMITPIPDMPAGTVGFEATGKVTEQDYRSVLLPSLKTSLDAGGVRLLYVLGDDFDSYSAGAVLQDAKLGLGHLRGWERTALVTNHDGWASVLRAFAWLFPGEARVFSTSQLDEAKAWLAPDTARGRDDG
jgi:hypothetical protein